MGAVFTPTRTVVTVRRFQDMVAAGVWRDDERIELIDGEIVDMAPIGGPHAWTVTRTADVLGARLGDRAHLWVQLPIVLGDRSQPQPDLAVIRRKPNGYAESLPAAGDVLLAVEVSDTTAEYDRGVKLRLYAAHGVPEYWLVDVGARCVEVYRQPGPAGYASRREARGNDEIAIEALPGVTLRAGELFETA
jgi:Uma2 family endonuclease